MNKEGNVPKGAMKSLDFRKKSESGAEGTRNGERELGERDRVRARNGVGESHATSGGAALTETGENPGDAGKFLGIS